MKLYDTVKITNKRYNGKEGLITKIFPAGELADKTIYEIKFSENNNSGQFSEDELVVMNSYRHFYLYAKHWYKRTDIVEDLKILIQNRSGIDAIHLNTNDILENLIDLVWLSISRSGNPSHFFSEFVFDTAMPQEWWKFYGKEKDSQELITIKKCLSVMSLTNVSDIDGELGEPDFTILPEPEKNKDTSWSKGITI